MNRSSRFLQKMNRSAPSIMVANALREPLRKRVLEALADYVHEQKGRIAQRWMEVARESPDIPTAMKLSHEALEDHTPQLLDDLVSRLRRQREADEADTSRHSRSHGQAQWKAGLGISELIWELYIIRRVLTEEIFAHFVHEHSEFSAEEYREAEALIHDFFHRLTCDSVTQFADEQQRILEEKNAALSEINDSRIRLTRTVSHELRNILNALSMASQLLEEESDLVERREIGLRCRRNLADMGQVLNQLLDYSALVAGRAHLDLHRVYLPELFNEIVSDWEPVARENELTFEYKCDAELVEATTDKLKLRQVVGNLLSNAIKYRKPAAKGYVGVSFTKLRSDKWSITVADTGLGIAEEDMSFLFGDFNRIRPKAETVGTGLGLAICKEYVELLGGHIQVLSREGEGTRFEVVLPLRSKNHNRADQ